MTRRATNVRPGDPIRAQDWNDLLERTRRIENFLGLTGTPQKAPIGQILPFQYQSSSGDVLIGRLVNYDDSVGTEDYAIAKPYTHRPSVTVRGGHTYVYSTDFERTDTLAGNAETQVLTPGYEVGDLIYALVARESTGVLYDAGLGNAPVYWLQVNVDGRQWAQKFGT